MRVRFTDDDLHLFSQASHDRNPLHLDADYARTTQFGQRVVFGVLGGLCCASALEASPDRGVVGLTFEFVGPVFCGTEYTVRSQIVSESRIAVVLSEGVRPLIKAVFRLGPPPPSANGPIDSVVATPRTEAATLDRADVVAGMQRAGCWRPEPSSFAGLLDRLGLTNGVLSEGQIAALLWSSYVVGMELPGRRALFNNVALEFANGGRADAALPFDATVTAYDDRFGLLRIAATLGDFVTGQIRAFVREHSDPAADADTDAFSAGSIRCAGWKRTRSSSAQAVVWELTSRGRWWHVEQRSMRATCAAPNRSRGCAAVLVPRPSGSYRCRATAPIRRGARTWLNRSTRSAGDWTFSCATPRHRSCRCGSKPRRLHGPPATSPRALTS